MADKSSSSTRNDDRWAAQLAALQSAESASAARKAPITADRIVATALDLVASEGFDALTMRRVAARLQTGPASLYAHVRNKAELDDLLIGELSSRIDLPRANAGQWRAQFVDVCRRLRDQYLAYPGISRAAFGAMPNSIETLRLSEGMLGILLAGGVPAQTAAWTIDAALLYVSAYSFEASVRTGGTDGPDGPDSETWPDRDALIERFTSLPADIFPNTVAHARELTSGDGHQRFDFTLELMLGGLDAQIA